MKKYMLIIIVQLLTVCAVFSQENESNASILKGPYFGQRLPGKTPEIFAPGIISTNALEYSITISKNGNEIYFSRRQSRKHVSQIFAYKYENDQWELEGPLLFGWDGSNSEPNLSPDGDRLLFNSQRPLGDETEVRGKVWYVEKANGDWTTPKPVLNGGGMFATQANNGTIYLTRTDPEIAINSIKTKANCVFLRFRTLIPA